MGEALDHITRPILPWRTGDLTECGKNSEDVESVISRDEMIAKIRRQGKQRAAMSSCMTCWSAAQYNRDWNKSPSEVIARDTARGNRYATQIEDTQLDRELRAIAALIEAHRQEFDDFLAGLDAARSLDLRRRARAARLKREGHGPRRI